MILRGLSHIGYNLLIRISYSYELFTGQYKSVSKLLTAPFEGLQHARYETFSHALPLGPSGQVELDV